MPFALLAALALTADPFPYKEITLDNGLKVLSLEDHSAPVVAVHLWYHVGAKDEAAGRHGFAHMFEHMMFRGTDRLGPEDHFKYVRRVGGDCNAYTAFDQTVYVQELPANQLELALWLEAERMGFLKVDQAGYDTERKVVEEERRLGLNRPYGSIAEKALAELFPDRAYAWSPIGNIAHLRAASVQDLRDFWARYYVPNNATLVVVGAVTHGDVQRLARKYFGWMPREKEPPRVGVPPPGPFAGRSVKLTDPSAPAPAAGVVWRTVPDRHEDEVPLKLLGTILGGGTSSRLYRELVADKQLAVVALGTAFALEYDGLFAAGAVLTPFSSNGPKVVDAIKAQVAKLRDEPVAEKELLKAKNQLLFSLASEAQSVASRARALGSAAVLEGDASRVNRRYDRVRAVTAADLQRVARTYLVPDGAVVGTIEQNLLGALFGKKPSADEAAPITAKPESGPAPKVKAGLNRPADFPAAPPSADLIAPVKPAYVKATRPNGLKVIVVPKPGSPYVTVQLGLLAGTWSEPKPGVASLAAGMLTKGNDTFDEKQLSEELETYAITVTGSAGHDWSSVTAACLSDHLPRAVQRLAEIVRTPNFPAKELDKLKTQVIASLAISLREPATVAENQMRKQLFGDHPYGRPTTGDVADVKAVTAADLRAWWKLAARPDRAVLLFAGDIDAATASRLTDDAFGGWTGDGSATESTLPAPPEATATRIVLVDQPGAIQSQIRIGARSFRRDHPDYAVARVVGDYFGGAFSSRLNEVIRVQKGLTYGARGGFAMSKFDGQFTVGTFSKTDSTTAAVKAVLGEIERLRNEGPSAKELGDTKANFLGKVVLSRETPQQVAGELWTTEVFALPENHFEATQARVAKTNAEECLSLAREAVDPAKLVVVVVGSAEKLKAELEKIAPVTVIPAR